MFGFHSINDAGSILISEKHKHLIFSERGSISLTNSVVDRPSSGSVLFAKPVSTVEPPQIYVRLQSSRHSSLDTYMYLTGGPGNWTGFVMFGAAMGGGTLPLYVLEFCVCKNVQTAPNSGYGMTIFDEQENPVFSHADKLVKYSGFTKKWTMSKTGAVGSFTYFTFRSNVVIQQDDFINISSINKGFINQNVRSNATTFYSMELYKGNTKVLNLITQSSSFDSNPQRIGSMCFCIPICKFPISVYHN